MNKILLNFIQLERTKKEEQTVLWRVGTRRAFPVEEGTCWGQCSCKCHTGCYKSRENVSGLFFDCLGFFSLPTLGFLKPLFFPHQSNHPAAKWAERQERGLLQWNVSTHRAASCLHRQGGLHTFWMQLCRGGRKGSWIFFISFFFPFSFFFLF